MKTIAVNEKTFEILQELKRESSAKTFEEVVMELIKKTKRLPENMFGVDKKMKPFTSKDEAEFEGAQHV